MTGLLIGLCVVLGLAVGSFLNVVIWRVPRGESVAHPPSACPACGQRIRWYDNIPVLSWLVLRGRCRDCRAPISVRYPLVEAATAVFFGLGAAWLGASWLLPAFLYLAAISVALTLIDIDVRRLPDAIVLPSYLVGLVLLGAGAALTGEVGRLVPALVGMVALFVFYFAILFAYPQGMGFGDVKLAGVLGLYLGYLGWAQLVVGAFLAFLVGGLVGVAILATGRRRVKIPFAPYMLAGAWLGIAAGAPIATAYLQVTGLA